MKLLLSGRQVSAFAAASLAAVVGCSSDADALPPIDDGGVDVAVDGSGADTTVIDSEPDGALDDTSAPDTMATDGMDTDSADTASGDTDVADTKVDSGSADTGVDAPVDPCAPNPCLNGGSCASGDGGFVCTCATGYSGATCATNIDDCSPNPCLNGGTCIDGVASFTCTCAMGYSGATCGTNIDDCSPNPCLNGGTCTDGVASFTCTCATGYSGATCGTNIDDCSPNPCLNGGTCTDGVASFTCACPAAFTGATCATPKSPIFLETFSSMAGGGSGTQCASGKTVRHSTSVTGWSSSGLNAIHGVEHATGNFAASFYNNNAIVMTSGVAANTSGTTYTVQFLAGPSVWAACSQATGSTDGLALSVLRADNSVLATFTHLPGAWTGTQTLSPGSFTYVGDGSGDVRLRIETNAPTADRFGGAIDDVAIYGP